MRAATSAVEPAAVAYPTSTRVLSLMGPTVLVRAVVREGQMAPGGAWPSPTTAVRERIRAVGPAGPA